MTPHIVCITAGVGVLALGLGSLPHAPRLIWNGSASAPIGLYLLQHDRVAMGDWVLATPPPPAARLAAARGYLPLGVGLVKRVAAQAGDRICSVGDQLLIDGVPVAKRLRIDGQGRPLPRWQGCKRLHGDEIYLLNPAPASFDGRYFGPIAASAVVGRLVPLWTR